MTGTRDENAGAAVQSGTPVHPGARLEGRDPGRLKSAIPVIDLRAMIMANRASPQWAEAVAQVASDIRAACFDTGFFYIANHGVSENLVRNILDANRSFHARPESEKLALKLNSWMRGYQPMASTRMNSSARFKPAIAPNQLESFIIREDVLPDHPEFGKSPFAGPNQWPDDPDFRAVLERYFAATCALAQSLLPAFSVAVGEEPEYFGKFFDPPGTTLRLVHYPPSPVDRPHDYMGIFPHTDYGFFTILAQDAVGGLEIQRVDGTWVDAAALPGTFVVNIGDALARWTNGVFNSSPHRVINKSTVMDRYSVALFFDPNHATEIRCLDGFLKDDAVPESDPITFGDYYLERMDSNHPDRRRD